MEDVVDYWCDKNLSCAMMEILYCLLSLDHHDSLYTYLDMTWEAQSIKGAHGWTGIPCDNGQDMQN